MTDPKLPWPLDDPQHLEDALREQGASENELREWADSLSRLAEWQAPAPAAAETRRLVERLLPLAPQPAGLLLDRKVGLGDEFGQMLRLVRTQVTILQPPFWLASAIVVLLGGILLFSGANLNQAFILQILGPLLSYIGTASAFRASGVHMLEFELACPPSPRQLTLARLILVLSYDLLLGCLLTLLSWSQNRIGVGYITLHWLAPLLLGVGLTLLLSLRIPVHQAAGVTYIGWLAVLVLSLIGQNALQGAGPAFSSPVELALGAAGLLLIGITLARTPKAVLRLLPRQ